MLKRDDVLKILRGELTRLQAVYHVRTLALFGSVGRDEATEQSDVGVLVEFERGASLFDLNLLEDDLQTRLGTKVDVVPKNGLRPRIRERVLLEAVAV